MRVELEELGYPASTVKKLEPVEAHYIVTNRVRFQPKKPAHIKHNLDGEKPSETIILGAAPSTPAKKKSESIKSELE